MAVWRTSKGYILFQQGDGYYEINPEEEKVRLAHIPYRSSIEYDLITTTYRLAGDKLHCHVLTETTEPPDPSTFNETSSVAAEGLVPLQGEEAERWKESAPGIVAWYRASARQETHAREYAEAQMLRDFDRSIPGLDAPTDFVLRRSSEGGWCVSREGEAPFWSNDTMDWWGKDILRLFVPILRRRRHFRDIKVELDGLDDELCYHGE